MFTSKPSLASNIPRRRYPNWRCSFANSRSRLRVSVRPVCKVLRFDRSTYLCRSRRDDPANPKARIKEICETIVRYGHRQVHYVLRREGCEVDPKRVYRI